MGKIIYFIVIPFLILTGIAVGVTKLITHHQPDVSKPMAVKKAVITQEIKPVQIATSSVPLPEPVKPVMEYTIKPGDTIFKIAMSTGIPQDDIFSANNLTQNSLLKIGQVVTIPGAASGTPAVLGVKIASVKPTATQHVVSKAVVKKAPASTVTSGVTWTSGALGELRRIPSSLIRSKVKAKITAYAKSHGIKVITKDIYLGIRI